MSWGVIRPSGKTAVASTKVSPGPREAIPPTDHRLSDFKTDSNNANFVDIR